MTNCEYLNYVKRARKRLSYYRKVGDKKMVIKISNILIKLYYEYEANN